MSNLKVRKLDISTILAVVKAQNQSGSISPSTTGYAVVREIQNAGVNSNVSFSSNVRTLRQINDIQFNNIGISLSGTPNWTITIPTAGTYAIYGRAVFYITRPGSTAFLVGANSKLFIRNETLGLDDWIVGDSIIKQYHSGGENSVPNNMYVELTGIVTITSPTVISMRQVCNSNVGSPILTGGGAVNILGTPEVYSTLTIEKLS